MPPRSSSGRFIFSAAGFIATRALGRPPGVRMSREAKWIWNAETPARVPAGARISAGKSGSVTRSLPIRAVAAAKRLPASCMPSPESPAKRTTTRSFSSRTFVKSLQKRQAFRVRFYAPVWTGSLRADDRRIASGPRHGILQSRRARLVWMEGRYEGWKPYVLEGRRARRRLLRRREARPQPGFRVLQRHGDLGAHGDLAGGGPPVGLSRLAGGGARRPAGERVDGRAVLRGAGDHRGEHARGARRRLPAAGAGGFPRLAGAGPGCDRPGDPRGAP